MASFFLSHFSCYILLTLTCKRTRQCNDVFSLTFFAHALTRVD